MCLFVCLCICTYNWNVQQILFVKSKITNFRTKHSEISEFTYSMYTRWDELYAANGALLPFPLPMHKKFSFYTQYDVCVLPCVLFAVCCQNRLFLFIPPPPPTTCAHSKHKTLPNLPCMKIWKPTQYKYCGHHPCALQQSHYFYAETLKILTGCLSSRSFVYFIRNYFDEV